MLTTKKRDFQPQPVHFKSLTENIDTIFPASKLQFHFFSTLAEFERDTICERTITGFRSARSRGRIDGRPKIMTDEEQIPLSYRNLQVGRCITLDPLLLSYP